MKQFITILILLTMAFNGFSQDKTSDKNVTTYYFIRHAEKDRSNPEEKNPHLNADGLKRAESWNQVLSSITFDAVYATDYFRTFETGQPTADKNNVEITTYTQTDIKNPKAFLENTKGKTVLVVGHSNTTPQFVNAILGQEKYLPMDDNNNGNLYIVTIIDGKASDQLLHID